jgi:hypothetical protein
LDTYPNNAFEMLGKTYLEKIGLLDSQTSRITDKMPFNMMMKHWHRVMPISSGRNTGSFWGRCSMN